MSMTEEMVAPARGRGLKYTYHAERKKDDMSPPQGGVD